MCSEIDGDSNVIADTFGTFSKKDSFNILSAAVYEGICIGIDWTNQDMILLNSNLI